MLDSMRTLSKSIVSKLLMAFLVISFGIWGVGDILRSTGPSFAAKVGSETIGLNELQHQRSLMARQLQTMGMNDVDPNQLTMTVIRQLIQQKLTLMAMQDTGLFVNEELVGKTIARLPDFQDKDGKFDGKKFASTLKSQNLPERAFVGQLKKEIAGRFLMDSLNMTDAPPPASVMQLETLVAGETRDAVLLTIPARDALDEANTEAFKKYYEEKKELFYMQPESRTLEYVVLTPAEIDALVDRSITDEMLAEAKKTLADTSDALVRLKLRGEQRDDVMHTLSNTIEDELAAGRTMAEAFNKAGVKAEPRTLSGATTEMGKTSTDDVIKTVAEQGFGLSEGEISNLISTKKGTLLMVSVKAIAPAAPKPYDAVKADVKVRLGKQLAKDAARAKAVSVKEALAKSPNWQATASEFNLTSRVVSNIPRPLEGKLSNAVPLPLQHAMFERNVGEVAGPLTLDNGDQVVALITESHMPKVAADTVPDGKLSAAVTGRMAQDIENRAFSSFSAQHKVKVNPGIMQTSAEAQ